MKIAFRRTVAFLLASFLKIFNNTSPNTDHTGKKDRADTNLCLYHLSTYRNSPCNLGRSAAAQGEGCLFLLVKLEAPWNPILDLLQDHDRR